MENGEYWLQNKGDLALLEVMVSRLRARWPRAEIAVLTAAPALLRALEPEAVPVHYRHERARWPRRRATRSVLSPTVAGALLDVAEGARSVSRRVSNRLRRELSRRHPNASEVPTVAGGPGHARAEEPPALRRDGGDVPGAVVDASLVIAMGGGYLTDVDLHQSHRTLALLDYAAGHGIPTAMLGQGIGPIRDEGLLAHAARVLPKVDLIALRENRRGPDLLRSMGVSDDRVLVTGDDAVELGYRVRADAPGSDIGVCLRVAGYSPVAEAARAEVGEVVRSCANAVDAWLRPLIVSEYLSEDRRATLPLLDGFAHRRPTLPRYARASALAQEVSHCRIVVTGAYHVAVFALAQGIPVVGLSSSEYYDDKLAGLGSMFGSGLEVVRLDAEGLATTLDAAVRRAWENAPDVREPLRARAQEQISLSQTAFDRACRRAEL